MVVITILLVIMLAFQISKTERLEESVRELKVRYIEWEGMVKDREAIAEVVKKVSVSCGYERGAVCAVDCLLQWKANELPQTLQAWLRHIDETQWHESHTDTQRHGAWVPAIPCDE